MATTSTQTTMSRESFKLCIDETKKQREFRVHSCAMRCLQYIIDDMEGEADPLPLAIELIFIGIADMKNKATSNRKRKNVYRADVEAWFASRIPSEEDKLAWESPADLNDGKFHGVRKIIGMRVENGREFYLIDWQPSEEPRTNLSVKLIAAFKRERRMIVKRAFIEAEAEEASKSKKRRIGSC